MPSTPPPGEPVGPGGPIAPGTETSPTFGIYVHVPYCATRCGYCDFNTYVATELTAGATPADYLRAARTEITQAAVAVDAPPVSTIFFGGGTPTLLGAGPVAALLTEIHSAFGIADGAEITVEANPENVTAGLLDELLAAGVTRISLGMQSASPAVLATLDRHHTPGGAVAAARLARERGFGEVSLDLIYGTPGETAADWERSLCTALAAEPTHVSAYALVVESGTALARKVARNELQPVDDDALAERYEVADALLTRAGLAWYEISNWGSPCRHNLGYWRSNDWWGVGPGAHSHVRGTRWWNVRHPAAYTAALAADRSPAQAREVLDDATRMFESLLLRVRLAEGVDVASAELQPLVVDGLLEPEPAHDGRAILTLRGRLLADLVVRRLTGS